MKRSAGIVLARLLVVLLAGGAVWALRLTYHEARNAGEGMDDIGSFVTFCFAVPCALAAFLLVLSLRLLGTPRRDFLAALLCWMLLLGCLLAGSEMGRREWGREFERNRQRAADVIARLEEFRATNGEYPGSLEQAAVETPVTIRRGDHTYALEYHRYSPTVFVLRYSYGWYEYVYDSANGAWEAHE